MLTFSSLSANPAAYQQAPSQMDPASQIRLCEYYILKLQSQNSALSQQLVLLKQHERNLTSQLNRGLLSFPATGFRARAIELRRVALLRISKNRVYIQQLYDRINHLTSN